MSVSLPRAISAAEKTHREKHAFTLDEIKTIASCGLPDSDALFYSILSGWRPSEVIALKTVNVNLALGYVVGGSKTDAGRERIVPIHPLVRPMLESLVKEQKEYLFGIKHYSTYKLHCQRIFSLLDTPHTPHDARRTFATLAKSSGMDEYALKRIIGHSITDLTEKVYTDRPVSWLIDEMRKIDISLDDANLSYMVAKKCISNV